MCGPHRRSSAGTLRRIPQAVGAVATGNMDDKQFTDELVSIPQAVSTVAMMVKEKKYITGYQGFNTVNGKFSPH